MEKPASIAASEMPSVATEGVRPFPLEQKVQIALRVGLADVLADGTDIDDEALIVLTMAEQLPLGSVCLHVDSERQNQRALRHRAARVDHS